MSLNFDLTKIKDMEAVCYPGGQMSGVTTALIYATITTGIGEISEKTVDEFFTRLRAWETGLGTFLFDTSNLQEKRFIRYEEVRAHIGLKTNVFLQETREKFRRKLGDALLREAEGALRRSKG